MSERVRVGGNRRSAEIEKGAGSQLDREMVKAFGRLIGEMDELPTAPPQTIGAAG